MLCSVSSGGDVVRDDREIIVVEEVVASHHVVMSSRSTRNIICCSIAGQGHVLKAGFCLLPWLHVQASKQVRCKGRPHRLFSHT